MYYRYTNTRSHFKWAPRITSKEVIFKENNLDKSYCTQRGTSNGNLEIVLNDLSQGYSKVKVFFNDLILITGIDKTENFTLQTWVHMFWTVDLM